MAPVHMSMVQFLKGSDLFLQSSCWTCGAFSSFYVQMMAPSVDWGSLMQLLCGELSVSGALM